MNQVSLNTKIEPKEKEEFDAIAQSIGLSTSAVLRNFVKSFNRAKGFPYDINYPISGEERKSVAELRAEMKSGTSKSFSSVMDMLDED